MEDVRTIEDFAELYTEWFGEAAEVIKLSSVFPGKDAPVDAASWKNWEIHVLPRADVEDGWVYLTAGPSLRPFSVPTAQRAAGVSDRAEYVFYARARDPRYARMLAEVMLFPYSHATHFDFAYTMRLLDALDGSARLDAALFLRSPFPGHRAVFEDARVEGASVNFLWVVPITGAELERKKAQGLDALLDLFDEHRHPPVFGTRRVCYVSGEELTGLPEASAEAP